MKETAEVRAIWKEALSLLQKGWCQNEEVLDEEGEPTDCMDTRAVRFCIVGALYRASHKVTSAFSTPEHPQRWMDKTAGLVLGRIGTKELLSDWNDDPYRVQEDVVIATRRTLKRFE